MKNSKWIVDVLLLISFVVLAVTGVIMFVVFPAGQKTGQKVFLGMIRNVWGNIHNWVGLFIIILAVLHFLQYLPMFRAMTKNVFKK